MNKVVVRSTLANLNDHVIKSSQPVVFSFSSSSFKLSIRYLLTSRKLSTFVQVRFFFFSNFISFHFWYHVLLVSSLVLRFAPHLCRRRSLLACLHIYLAHKRCDPKKSSSFKLSIRYLLTSRKLSTFVQVCSSSVSPPLLACLLTHLSRSQKVCSSSVSPPLLACLLTHLSRSQKLKSLQ
jgi:hypothetical protein